MVQVPYWKSSKKGEKTEMSVSEMRKMLGLSKGEGYYLVHTGKFKVTEEDGEYRIDIESFEKWYANQVNFSKVEGPPPGEELKKNSYSVRDISEMLGISVDCVLEILKRDKVETFTVDLRKHVTKENFDKWYHSQTRYRTAKDREETREIEEDSIWLPDMARMLGIGREQVYRLVKNKDTRDQFDVIVVDNKKRVTKESFYRWYENQTEYHLLSEEEFPEMEPCKEKERTGKRARRLARGRRTESKNACIYDLKEPENSKFYTINEITEIYGFSKNTVLKWIHDGVVESVRVGKTYRLPREEFNDWLDLMST